MKITTVTIKEDDWDRLYDEIESKYGIVTTIGSDYTSNEMAESARELFKVKTIFAEKYSGDTNIMIFSKRHLSRVIFKAIAEFYNSDYDDNGVVVKTSVLKTLLGKKRYAKLIR